MAQDNTAYPATELSPDEGAPHDAAGSERLATVLQVLPAMEAGGGVERGTVEIARAIAQAGGRALVASAGGNLEHEIVRARETRHSGPSAESILRRKAGGEQS